MVDLKRIEAGRTNAPVTLAPIGATKSNAVTSSNDTDFVPQPSTKGSLAPKYKGTTFAKTRGEGQIGVKATPKLEDSSGFKKLSASEQKQMLDARNLYPNDPGFAADLRHVAGSESYRKLDPEMKAEVLAALVHQAGAPKGSNCTADVVAKPGFSELSKDQQKALIRITSGRADKYSEAARKELEAGADLKTFLAKQSFLPDATTADVGTFSGPGKRVPYKITGPANPAAKVKTYQIEIDGRKIPVTMNPPPAGKKHHTVDDVAKAIAAAPKESRDKIKSVLFHADVRPGAYMAANGDGTLHLHPQDDLPEEDFTASAVIHETGHMVSIAKWGGDAANGPQWKSWRDAMAKDVISPSKYGQGKPTDQKTTGGGAPVHDDFAESVLLYQRVKGTPQEAEMRRIFPERFKILDTMLK